MKPAFNKATRRQFLLGTGGLALPLPLLPSLFPGDAQAQVVAEGSKRFFVHTTTYHAVFASQFYGPLLAVAPTERIANYAGFEIRKAPLKSTPQANGTFISPFLQTKTAPISAKILGLINVINGLDMTTAQGHNFAGALGGGGSTGAPSIDQVMAASKKLFPGTQGAPAIVRHKVSLTRVNGSTQATTNTALTNVKLFDLLFGTNVASDQPLIVDAVRAHHNAVRTDPTISAECRALMDAHVELMFQAETNLRNSITPGAGGARPATDTGTIEKSAGFVNDPARQAQVERLWNDVVVAAFASGLSRVYVWGPDDEYTFSTIARGPWHDGIAHQLSNNASTQATYNGAGQLQFESGLIDMANKLDAVRTADGKTLLDKSLLAYGMEMGSAGIPGFHHGRGIPIVSIGNAGGFFNTGLSVDYRDLNSFAFSASDIEHWYSGLTYNQWMAMVLRSMGMLPSEYSTNNGAFGYPSVSVINSEHPQAQWNLAGTDLPFLRGTAAPPTF
jgi:hypothetical protein